MNPVATRRVVGLRMQGQASARGALTRSMRGLTARSARIRTIVFDTPNRDLWRAGLSLTLRFEQERWTQTLCLHRDDRLARDEHTVPVRAPTGDPDGEPDLHTGTPPGAALAEVLSALPREDLKPIADFGLRRTSRVLHFEGSIIELSLDEGLVRSGPRKGRYSDLSLELRKGSISALAELAQVWQARHDLWMIDQRFWLLRMTPVEPASASPVARSVPLVLETRTGRAQALRQIIGHGLAHLLPNISALAVGDGLPEHLHQARVALRRLRSALRVFGDWSARTPPTWPSELAGVFQRLGQARETDAFASSLKPELAAAGAPLIEWPALPAREDVQGIARDPAFQSLLLRMIGFARSGGPASGSDKSRTGKSLRADADDRLERMHRRLRKDTRNFPQDTDEARHLLRKRLKRLRYALEFMASLYEERTLKPYLERLHEAQESLGRFCDLTTAQAAFERALPADPRAWFAIGWLASRRPALIGRAHADLRQLSKATPPWR